jgi:hypothetical protein
MTTTVTATDVHLAKTYFGVLVEVAKQQKTIPYGQLVQEAKTRYPNDQIVQNAIPVSTGRRLNVVRLFTNQKALPDLTSLAISKSTEECGAGFLKSFDPEQARRLVFAHDWNALVTDFSGFIAATESDPKQRKRKKIKEPQALEILYAHYKENRATLPKSLGYARAIAVELIMEGIEPAIAYAEALASIEG